jgi:hypothetical protein
MSLLCSVTSKIQGPLPMAARMRLSPFFFDLITYLSPGSLIQPTIQRNHFGLLGNSKFNITLVCMIILRMLDW